MAAIPVNNGKIGLALIGEFPGKNMAFAVASGIDVEESKIDFFTGISAPEPDQLHVPHPGQKPGSFRSEILQLKERAMNQNKQFLIKDVNQIFEEFLQNNISQLSNKIKQSTEDDASKLIHSKIKDHSPAASLQLKVFFLEYEQLEFDGQQQEDVGETTTSSPSKQSALEEIEDTSDSGAVKDHDEETDEVVLEISPTIDAREGGSVKNLRKDTKVWVELAGKSTELLKDSESSPEFPAHVLNFRNKNNGEPEGTLRVRIQDGVLGECEIPPNTRLKNDPPDTSDPTENRILLYMGILATGLIMVFLLFFFLIF